MRGINYSVTDHPWQVQFCAGMYRDVTGTATLSTGTLQKVLRWDMSICVQPFTVVEFCNHLAALCTWEDLHSMQHEPKLINIQCSPSLNQADNINLHLSNTSLYCTESLPVMKVSWTGTDVAKINRMKNSFSHHFSASFQRRNEKEKEVRLFQRSSSGTVQISPLSIEADTE